MSPSRGSWQDVPPDRRDLVRWPGDRRTDPGGDRAPEGLAHGGRVPRVAAFAQMLPGPIAVATAAHIGWRLHRGVGTFLAMVSYISPAFLLMLGLSAGYFHYRGDAGGDDRLPRPGRRSGGDRGPVDHLDGAAGAAELAGAGDRGRSGRGLLRRCRQSAGAARRGHRRCAGGAGLARRQGLRPSRRCERTGRGSLPPNGARHHRGGPGVRRCPLGLTPRLAPVPVARRHYGEDQPGGVRRRLHGDRPDVPRCRP